MPSSTAPTPKSPKLTPWRKTPTRSSKQDKATCTSSRLPASKMNLVKNVLKAFTKDSEKAYGYNRGKASQRGSGITVAVGETSTGGVKITSPGQDYVYALFLAPKQEDSSGTYRYAYCMSYKESGNKIVGQLAITYATTLKYRQEQESKRVRSFTYNRPEERWIEKVMYQFSRLPRANKDLKFPIARNIYSTIAKVNSDSTVTVTDKNAARELVKTAMADPKNSDKMVQTILSQCLEPPQITPPPLLKTKNQTLKTNIQQLHTPLCSLAPHNGSRAAPWCSPTISGIHMR